MDLNHMALLGTLGKDMFEQWGVDDNVLEKAMENHKDLEPVERFSAAMDDYYMEILTKAPMFNRFNMLSHKLFAAVKNGYEDKIDWDKVNELLKKNRNPYDFNAYSPIQSYAQFIDVADDCRIAAILGGMWHEDKCKDCGKTFYMTKSEVDFFAHKDLMLPRRCKECRDKRKGIVKESSTQKVKSPVGHAPAKTAMAIALEKAGLIK